MLEGQTFAPARLVALPRRDRAPDPLAERRRERLLRLTSRLNREDIEATIDALIARLDVADGDPDVELNGDELDDPGDLADAGYTEWHARGRHKMTRQGAEIVGRARGRRVNGDDDEDDDPKETAWTEWHGRPFAVSHEGDVGRIAATEDDEEDEHPDAEPDAEPGTFPETGGGYQGCNAEAYDDGHEDDGLEHRRAFIDRARRRVGRSDRWGESWTLSGAAYQLPDAVRASEMSA